MRKDVTMTDATTIESLIAQWVDAFNAHDLARHVQLYTEDATLFGSTDELHQGQDAIRGYFAALPAGARVAHYPPPVITLIGDAAATTAAHVDFANGDTLLPYRLTWTLVQRAGNWKIAQHHGSPRSGTAHAS